MISRLTCSISDFGETLHCFDLETILMRSGVAFPDLDIDWTVPAAAAEVLLIPRNHEISRSITASLLVAKVRTDVQSSPVEAHRHRPASGFRWWRSRGRSRAR
jgi:hypothetical protein